MHHPEVFVFLLSLAVLLGAARLFGEIAHRLGWPAVVGEIIAGIFIGKTVLGRFAPGAFQWLFRDGAPRTLLQGYTTVAVVLLLVVAGLEIDLSMLRRSGRAVVLTSMLGAVIPFVLGYGSGLLLPDHYLADPSRRGLHAAFLGIALAISALPVITRTLMDLGLMKSEIGMLVLSSAVVDDITGWVCFSVLAREFGATGATDVRHLGISVLLTVGFVIATLLIVRPIVDRWLRAMQPSPTEPAATPRVLSMVMVLAMLGAAATEALGIHAVFGGFVMGLAIGDSPRLREHTRHVLQDFVTSIFTPVFFATMALRYDFVASFDPVLVALVLGIACVAKVLGCAAGARLGGAGKREAFAIGFGMNSRGAMEILLAVIALEAKIINEKIFVALVVMAVVTSLISGPAMARLLRATPSPVQKLLRSGAILLDLPGLTRKEAIESLTAALCDRGGRPDDARRFSDAVLHREETAGTGVGDGVAFPHAEAEGLTEPALAFGRSTRGLDFDSPDGQPSRLVFLLLTPKGDYEGSLRLLAGMARLLAREDVRASLLAAKDPAAVIATLNDPNRAPVSSSAPSSRGIPPSRKASAPE
jgi:Kef-type K+ transport system membrane component KefB/mannitol/fructose-specific phosphotransferase system IIA component (Ntr-type)